MNCSYCPAHYKTMGRSDKWFWGVNRPVALVDPAARRMSRPTAFRDGPELPMQLVMSARTERDQLARELEAARKRIAELESALLRRGRDTLTAVLRIEAFREQLVEELHRAHRRGLYGALVVLQVDRLSDVHRDHGFAIGDAVLSALVESLRAGTRAEDVIGRTGDDRFVLLLREAGEGATSACVGRLLGDLQALEVGPVKGISTSAGVALFGPEDGDPVALFDTAGRALADAQAAGGGRAVIATGDGDGLGVSAELHRRDAVEALAIALLERDRYTGEHSESVVEMAVGVARGLGLSTAQVEDVRAAALLHDIGKVGIPDAILNKPGPLTPEERTVMAEHPGHRRAHPARDRRLRARSPTSSATSTSPTTARATPTASSARTSRSAAGSSSPATPTTR